MFHKMMKLCLLASFIVVLGLGKAFANTASERSKKILRIGNAALRVEIAKTPEELTKGLMGRTVLGEDEGMLFIFSREEHLSFWMKNTLIPLSIGFFNKERVLLEVLEMEPPKSIMQKELPRYQSRDLALYALEVNKGWFERNGIKPGPKTVFELRAKGLD